MPEIELLPTPEWLASLRRGEAGGPPATNCVRLVGFPVVLGEQQSERSQELMRELRLLLIGRDRGDISLREPSALLDLTQDFVSAYSHALAGATAERQEAQIRGEASIDVEYPLHQGSRELLIRYAAAMEDMDDYCRSDTVMTLPSPPEMVALRRWIVEEFIRQYDGLPPRPWTGPY